MPQPSPPQDETGDRPGSAGQLLAIIVSAGLAWATAVTLVAWILGRLLASG